MFAERPADPAADSGPEPFSLTTKYRTDAKKLAQERLALGGARLANLLNNELN